MPSFISFLSIDLSGEYSMYPGILLTIFFFCGDDIGDNCVRMYNRGGGMCVEFKDQLLGVGSPLPLWVLGLTFRSSGFCGNAFTHGELT